MKPECSNFLHGLPRTRREDIDPCREIGCLEATTQQMQVGRFDAGGIGGKCHTSAQDQHTRGKFLRSRIGLKAPRIDVEQPLDTDLAVVPTDPGRLDRDRKARSSIAGARTGGRSGETRRSGDRGDTFGLPTPGGAQLQSIGSGKRPEKDSTRIH